ncbi:unnamed protein product, partial [Hapterophycus canaliculatus]
GEYGRLGHGNERDLSCPTLIPSLVGVRIRQVAAGRAHSMALSWSGEVYTWGWGFGHVLGLGDEKSRFEPTRPFIPPDATVGRATCICAGTTSTVIGTSSGRILFCGKVYVGGVGL